LAAHRKRSAQSSAASYRQLIGAHLGSGSLGSWRIIGAHHQLGGGGVRRRLSVSAAAAARRRHRGAASALAAAARSALKIAYRRHRGNVS